MIVKNVTHQAVKILTSSDILIDGCDLSWNGMGGIDCGVKDNGEYGISNLTVKNTHLDENGWYGPYPADWADGLAIETGGGNILIENCTAIHNRADGFDSKTVNTTVRKCTALNNIHNQIKLWADNALIENCIAANASNESGYWDCVVFEGTSGDKYRMYNTLIYGSQNYAMIAGYDHPGTNAYFEVKNCIFANNHGGAYFQSSSTVVEDHNIYYGSESGEELFKNGISYTSTAINNGLSDPTNKSLNPLFTDPANNNFILQPDSPAMDAGTAIDFITTDIAGTTRPQGNGYDIGPYEHTLTLTVKEGDLETFIISIESSMPGKDSELYTDPTAQEKITFQDIITYILAQDIIQALNIANELNYEIIKFTETSNNSIYYILKEKTPISKGWGTYIFNPNPQNELIIEIPHPVYEFGTCQAGIQMFIKENAKAFLLAGTHRYANADGSSDVAHNANSIFELVHETILNFGASKVVQIHGFSLEKHPGYPDIVLSDGTSGPLPEFYKLKINLEAFGLTVGIYNGSDYSDLGATTNVQGQYINSEGKEFYHIELSDALRSDPAKINTLENILGALSNNPPLSSAKNIILFIGDGMGFEQVKAGRIFAVGPTGYLNFESLDTSGTVTTNSLSGITDSAAAATAIAAGHKVYNGYVSQDQNNTEYKTILEYAKILGKRTGIVTTTEITDATPAGFGSHTDNRNNWNEIANDYIYGSQPNIIFGGGQKYWLPSNESGSVRSDNGLIDDAETQGYIYVDTSTELDCLDMNTEDKVLGLFNLGNMSYEYNKPIGTTEPDLSTMVDKALDLLEEDPDGFFFMVEGGLIDKACHSNNITNAVYEIAELDDAVSTVLSWAISHPDTLIIITADHETGGLQVINGDYVMGQIPNVTWSTTGHTSENVPIWLNSFSGSLPNPIDNTDIFKYMLGAFLKEANNIIKDWPADSGTLIGNAANLGAGYEPSGAVWHSGLNKLIIIGDGGDVSTMNVDGSNVTIWHPGGDIEGVTIADPTINYIYLGIENPDSIKEFNIATGQLTGKTWDLTPWLISEPNSGLEALTFVPNGKTPYPDSNSGGLFYAGLQQDGKIYIFDVDLSTSGKVSFIDKITPDSQLTDISDMDYNEKNNLLFAIFDTANILIEMKPDGTIINKYKLPGNDQEGFAVIAQPYSNSAQVIIAEDLGPEVWRYDNYPIN